MSDETPTKWTERIYRVLPYSGQIKELKITERAVYFTWRSDRFRVCGPKYGVQVDTTESNDSILVGSNVAMLLKALLQKTVSDEQVAALKGASEKWSGAK